MQESRILLQKDNNKKFNEFNDKILKNSRPINENKIKEILTDLGYDYQRIEKEIKKDFITNLLNQDLELAKDLELRGTPVFIINNEIFLVILAMMRLWKT